MVIIIFTLCFAAVFLLTKSYKFLGKYYSTALYISYISILYQVLCQGHMMWHFRDWLFFTDKLSTLTQFVVLFPCTIVLFMRYLPQRKWTRTLYFLGFVGVYVVMEILLNLRGEIVYQYGWTFWWSVFIDFCIFAIAWIHARSWKTALSISTCIIVSLMVWFRVPLTG